MLSDVALPANLLQLLLNTFDSFYKFQKVTVVTATPINATSALIPTDLSRSSVEHSWLQQGTVFALLWAFRNW